MILNNCSNVGWSGNTACPINNKGMGLWVELGFFAHTAFYVFWAERRGIDFCVILETE